MQLELRNRHEYIAAVKKGIFSYPNEVATGLNLEAPRLCRLFLNPTAAGRIPVVAARLRTDFVTLIRALTKKGEPEPIPRFYGSGDH